MNMQQRRLDGWRRLAFMPMLLAAMMLVLAGSFIFPATAHAQSGDTIAYTITVASPAHLMARTTLKVTGTASCTLPAGGTLIESVGITVTVDQVSNKQIVQASGFGGSLATCDGQTYPILAYLTPPAGSAPFHHGSAVVTSSLFVSWTDAAGNFREDTLANDPVTFRITK